jgi:hypothetical protein
MGDQAANPGLSASPEIWYFRYRRRAGGAGLTI